MGGGTSLKGESPADGGGVSQDLALEEHVSPSHLPFPLFPALFPAQLQTRSKGSQKKPIWSKPMKPQLPPNLPTFSVEYSRYFVTVTQS